MHAYILILDDLNELTVLYCTALYERFSLQHIARVSLFMSVCTTPFCRYLANGGAVHPLSLLVENSS